MPLLTKKKFVILWFTLMGLFIMISAGNADIVKFTDLNKPIMVAKSQPEFTITLEANPTTGYIWILENYDEVLVEPVSETFYPPQKQMLGAGGYDKWTFKVKPQAFKVPHVIKLQMIYARPWAVMSAKVTEFFIVTY